MKRYNITAPKQYEKDGQVKTTYPQVGKAILWEANGDKKESMTIELFMYPGVTFKAFPDEPRDNQGGGRASNGFHQNVEQGAENQEVPSGEEEIDINDIPF